MPTIPLTGDPIVINIIVQLLSAGSSNALALGGVGSSGLGSTGLGSFDSQKNGGSPPPSSDKKRRGGRAQGPSAFD